MFFADEAVRSGSGQVRQRILPKEHWKLIFSNAEEKISQLTRENKALTASFDIDYYISLLDAIPEHAAYHDMGAAVRSFWADIRAAKGDAGFEVIQRLTLLRLITQFPERAAGKNYSDSILQCFAKSLDRIQKSAGDPEFRKYGTENDIFFKDLALARQKMIPAGAQVIEPYSGFPRSLILKQGIGQAFRIIALLFRAGGNRPWYQIHTHLSELDDFNPEGWDQCYLRIAEMLERHPQIKGMMGGSWFYDPALEKVSPRLTYLRKRPQENGASVFYSGIDLNGGALSKSASRKALYKKGEYIPKSYFLLWPRVDLLEWARRQKISTTASIPSND